MACIDYKNGTGFSYKTFSVKLNVETTTANIFKNFLGVIHKLRWQDFENFGPSFPFVLNKFTT